MSDDEGAKSCRRVNQHIPSFEVLQPETTAVILKFGSNAAQLI